MNSIICTLRFGSGVKGGLFVDGAPKMKYIYIDKCMGDECAYILFFYVVFEVAH